MKSHQKKFKAAILAVFSILLLANFLNFVSASELIEHPTIGKIRANNVVGFSNDINIVYLGKNDDTQSTDSPEGEGGMYEMITPTSLAWYTCNVFECTPTYFQNTCDGWTCSGTCGSSQTCWATCGEWTCDGPTCNGATCFGTCYGYTCDGTCDMTCYGPTCESSCVVLCLGTASGMICSQ